MDLDVGQVIRLRKFEDHDSDETKALRFTFVADGRQKKKDKDKKVFVCLLLGIEPLYPKDGERLDCNEILKSMGWSPPKNEK